MRPAVFILSVFFVAALFGNCSKDSTPVNVVEVDSSVCDRVMDTTGYNLHFPPPFTEYEMKYVSYKDKISKIQLSEELLTTLTLEELFNHCMWWELVGNVLLFNTFQQGFRAYYSHFNGIRELYNRENVHVFLENKLRGFDKKDMVIGRCGLYNHLLEFMYVQPECLSHYEEAEVLDVLGFLFEKADRLSYLTTLESPNYTSLSFTQWMLGIGNILIMYEYQPFLDELEDDLELQAFFNARINATVNVIVKVSEFGTNFYHEIENKEK